MKVIFLDRDGVINEYPGESLYVRNWKEFKFIPGSIEGIRKLNEKDFKIFVVSNQAGVAKGIYSEDDLNIITKRMKSALRKQRAHLDGVYYCIHRDEDNCLCRKPKTGLLRRAVESLKETVTETFFIGDSFKDMLTARDFGSRPILVFSGKEKISNRSNWDFEPDFIFDNFLLAANHLCTRY
ncbi:MAG: HAD-IIIA family hydrolase [Candidatus Omnitrophota bacterium]